MGRTRTRSMRRHHLARFRKQRVACNGNAIWRARERERERPGRQTNRNQILPPLSRPPCSMTCSAGARVSNTRAGVSEKRYYIYGVSEKRYYIYGVSEKRYDIYLCGPDVSLLLLLLLRSSRPASQRPLHTHFPCERTKLRLQPILGQNVLGTSSPLSLSLSLSLFCSLRRFGGSVLLHCHISHNHIASDPSHE
jgi:hypothetical protein